MASRDPDAQRPGPSASAPPATALAGDNDVEYDSGGLRFKLHVRDELDYKLEIALQEDESELEVELSGAGTRAVHPRDSDRRALAPEHARLAVVADGLAATWRLTNSSRSSCCPVAGRSATASSARGGSGCCTVSDAPRS
jgi:hypothetical protein